jgi:sugar lactone lactonase YvrE
MSGSRAACALLGAAALLAAPAAALAAPDCDKQPTSKRVIASGQGRLESVISDPQGRLFYTDLAANRLLRLDRPDAEPTVLGPVQVPGGLAFDSDGSLMVGYGNSVQNGASSSGQAGLLRFDPDTGAQQPFVTGLTMANGLARGPDGTFYATNDFGGGIDRVRGSQVERRWADVASTNGLVVDSGGRYVYVAQTFVPAAVQRVEIANPANVRDFARADTADISAGLDGMTRDDKDQLYLAANGAGQVWRIDRKGEICVLARGLLFPSAVAFGGGGGAGFSSRNLYVVAFNGDLVELADVLRGGGGSAGTEPSERARLRLRVRPRRAVVGRRTRFRFRVTSLGSRRGPVAGARIRFAGRNASANARGRAAIAVKLRHARRYRARVSISGMRSDRAFVRAVPRVGR